MPRYRACHLVAGVAILASTGCSDTDDTPEKPALPDATSRIDPSVGKVRIRAIDFAQLDLGAKIEGPQGSEVKASLSSEAGPLARITSYVACPAGMDECDPATAPDTTIYTYVHIVEPIADLEGNAKAPFAEVAAFYMNNPAHGFMGHAGFARSRNSATDGGGLQVAVTCDDRGALAWRVDPGDGDDSWKGGEPITFFWQSLLPPAGPAPSYVLRASGMVGAGRGPYPADDPEAVNMCLHTEMMPAEGEAARDTTIASR